MGALIGAAYCSGVTTGELEDVARRVRFKTFARWTLSRHGFATNQRMIGFLHSILKVKSFEESAHSLGGDGDRFEHGRRRGVSLRAAGRSGARELRVSGNVFAGEYSRAVAGRRDALRMQCRRGRWWRWARRKWWPYT